MTTDYNSWQKKPFYSGKFRKIRGLNCRVHTELIKCLNLQQLGEINASSQYSPHRAKIMTYLTPPNLRLATTSSQTLVV